MPLVIAFLSALPTLWQIFRSLSERGSKDPRGDLEKIADVFAFLETSSTAEDRLEAAKRIRDLISD